jgi:hypothetical protein
MNTKNSTRTIRIDDDLDHKIGKMAKTEGISVNLLVNTALREYLEWFVVARRFGMGSFSLAFVDKLIEKFSDEECEELGRWSVREVFIPFVEYQYGNLSFDSFLKVFERFAKYTGRFKFDITDNGTEYILFLKHRPGVRKWSYFYDGLLRSILGKVLSGDVKTELTDDLIVVKISQSRQVISGTR